VAYLVANLEVALQFLMELRPGPEEGFSSTRDIPSHPEESAGRPSGSPRDERAMERLGEWLRDQLTMEQTIHILQDQGWMT
jgi:hypothetical protein